MKVIAQAPGFYGSLRHVDEEFDVPDDEPESSWFKPLEAEKKPAKEQKKEPPKS